MDSYLKNIIRVNEQFTTRGLAGENLSRLRNAGSDILVICGMGGSALAGSIIAGVADEIGLRVPVIIWKDYGIPKLPKYAKRPFYIFVSFSGNTEETLSGLAATRKTSNKGHVAIIATGGHLLRSARAKSLPLVTFSAGDLTPRQSSGRMYYAIVQLLLAARLITRKPQDLTGLRPIGSKRQGYALARRLRGKLIVIYTQTADKYLGYLWKIKFNESSKVPAFNNVLPEMNHNELVGFEKPPFPAAALMLLNKNAHGRVEKRFRVTERLLQNENVTVIKILLAGRTKLEQTWKTIMLADWASYALAKLNGVDARETDIIDGPRGLKASMRK
jgi:glucose/mannose-6-phosphate isomerase